MRVPNGPARAALPSPVLESDDWSDARLRTTLFLLLLYHTFWPISVADVSSLWSRLAQLYTAVNGGGNGAGEDAGALDMPVHKARRDQITLGTADDLSISGASINEIWNELDKISITTAVATPEQVRQQSRIQQSGTSTTGKSIELPRPFSLLPADPSSGPLGRDSVFLNFPGPDGDDGAAELGQLLATEFGGVDAGIAADGAVFGRGLPVLASSPEDPLLQVPEHVQPINANHGVKRRRQILMFDEQTVLDREDMFIEEVLGDVALEPAKYSDEEIRELTIKALTGQSVFTGLEHPVWTAVMSASIQVTLAPPKTKKRRSSGVSTLTGTTATDDAPFNAEASDLSSPVHFEDEANVVMPWSDVYEADDPMVLGSGQPKTPSSDHKSIRDSLGFIHYVNGFGQNKKSFQKIFPPGSVSRRVAARAFSSLLQAVNDEHVRGVQQLIPYGTISFE